MSRVLVTGGSGTLGRLVVDRLVESGHTTRVLSRMPSEPASVAGTGLTHVRGDLGDGTGLDEAVAGVDVIVHCASDPRNPRAIDVAGTHRLVSAARQAGGSAHLVYVSIVGVDKIPWSFYAAKHQAETVVRNSGLPWTVQRATQFHPFVAYLLGQLARSPLMLLPRGFRLQPVAPADVAARLVAQVAGGPVGQADDVGGPEVLDLPHLSRTWLSATGRRRAVLQVPAPGRTASAFRAGANLCPANAEGALTWRQFLEETARLAAGSHAAQDFRPW
jgi:uncharacterized protein YbjT (DUF2867 family)